MAGWVGFSDAELRRMKQQASVEEANSSQNGRPQASAARRQAQLNKQRPPTQRDKHLQQRNTQNSSSVSPQTDILPSQRLSQPKPQDNPKQKIKDDQKKAAPAKINPSQPTQVGNAKEKEKEASGNSDAKNNGHLADSVKEEGGCADEEQTDLNEKEIQDLEVSNMQKFQKQQKMIEEANKQKRQMLAKAIKERSLKAKAEASKLIQLEKELKHLDELLTVDVSILRDKIEEASRDYTEAQKRYERLEKEFIQSKMDLHKTADMKEQLTEHLYNLIYQNEIRKSKKLSELTAKLELAGTEEINTTLPDLPPLSMFSAVPAGQTLRSPTHGQHPSLGKQNSSTGQEAKPTGQEAQPTGQEAPPISKDTTPSGVKDVPTNQTQTMTTSQDQSSNPSKKLGTLVSDTGKSNVEGGAPVVTTQPGQSEEDVSAIMESKHNQAPDTAESTTGDSEGKTNTDTAGQKDSNSTISATNAPAECDS